MTYADVTHGDLYHGNMRFDVNISVAKADSNVLGKRAEVKNLNSFRSVEKAAEYEFKRQVELLERGEIVVQETRGWNDAKQKTSSQRSKEDAQDYRYMPDADIPPVILNRDEVEAIQATVGMLPADYRSAFADLSIDLSVVTTLLSNKSHAALVYDIKKSSPEHAIRVANWFASVFKSPDEDGINTDDESLPSSEDLIVLSEMTAASEVSSTSAKEIFLALVAGETGPRSIATQRDLLQLSDESSIATVVDEVLADEASQKSIADIKAGNDKAIGFLVGQVMKKSAGKANPALAQKLIRERIN